MVGIHKLRVKKNKTLILHLSVARPTINDKEKQIIHVCFATYWE